VISLSLGRFLQRLEETEHFRGWHQKEVAKIVQCGEKIEVEAIRKGGLKFTQQTRRTASPSLFYTDVTWWK